MSYGGPAMMGIMQAEIERKRQWVTRERFVEGLALVNFLPRLLVAAVAVGRLWVMPAAPALAGPGAAAPPPPEVWRLGVFFFKVGAFTFGGGLPILAFVEDQVVRQFRWLTAQEFIDGLALGQLT